MTETASTLVVHRMDGAREGQVCADCDPFELPDGPPLAEYEVGTAEARRPVCRWHADEAVHEALVYGANCRDCGREHAALWPTDATEPAGPGLTELLRS